ncbi:MAG: hypothetical protein RJQ04_16705 [Longimicrobiales bacterium]
MRRHGSGGASRLLVAVAVAVLVPGAADGQSWRTVTMSRQAEGHRPLDVQVKYGAGRFTIRPADDGLLYRMQLRYDEDVFEPVAEYDGHLLRLGVDNLGRSLNLGRNRSGGELELMLGRDVPMDLTMEFGAVRADLDLGGLELTDLRLSTGASESTVDVSEPNPGAIRTARFEVGAADFTARHLGNLNAERIEIDAGVGEITLWFNGDWARDAAVSIDMGLGALDLRFPEGLGVRLRKDSFLTSLDSEGLVKRGDYYYSLDWERAERKVTIDLDAAFGSVRVHWVR